LRRIGYKIRGGIIMKNVFKLFVVFFALVMVVAACSGGGDGGSTGNSGLVVYYPFGGNANDASGNGNNGTVLGATLTADRNSNANSAYSTMAGYIEVPHNSSLNVSDFTVTAWFRADDFSESYGVLVGKDYTTSYAIGIGAGASTVCPAPPGTFRRMVVYVNNVGLAFTASDFSCNTWHHVAVTYNNTSGVSELYVNGALSGTVTFSSGGLGASTYPMGIGRDGRWNDRFHGAIDEVRVYNRVLSAGEIQSVYLL
jgi:hypothetical protein